MLRIIKINERLSVLIFPWIEIYITSASEIAVLEISENSRGYVCARNQF